MCFVLNEILENVLFFLITRMNMIVLSCNHAHKLIMHKRNKNSNSVMDDMQICDSTINKKVIIDRDMAYRIYIFSISK